MAFVLEPISDEAVRRAVSNYGHAYQGNWAIDHSRNACLYFSGKDVRDPQIPEQYVFLLNGLRCSLQVIDSVYSAEQDKKPPGQLFFVVMEGVPTEASFSTAGIHTLIAEALKLFTKHVTSEHRFIDKYQQRAEHAHILLPPIVKPSWNSYWRALVPTAFFLALGILVLVLESSKH